MSNINRVFHALNKGKFKNRRQRKARAVETARLYPWYGRYFRGVDTAPWLG